MNVRDKIDAGDYDYKVPYDFVKIPVDETTMTVVQAREHVEAEKLRKRAYHDQRTQETARLTAKFRSDLELEHGVAGHPKAARLWELAWSHGHSSGYWEVVNFYEEFVELIQS